MGNRTDIRRRRSLFVSAAVLFALMATVVFARWDFVSALVQGDVHWCTTSGKGVDPNMMEC
jgi:hypothetical protein